MNNTIYITTDFLDYGLVDLSDMGFFTNKEEAEEYAKENGQFVLEKTLDELVNKPENK